MEILDKDELAPDALPEEDRPETPVPVEPAEDEAEPPPMDAPKAKRGEPVGSKNKVHIVEPQLPIVPEDPPEPPPKKVRRGEASRNARAPRAEAPAANPVSRLEAPIDGGIQSAAAMLHLLRAEQAERQETKALMYKSWVR